MDEKPEQIATMNFNGDIVRISPDNLTLFRHLGANAVYDHVFVTLNSGRRGYVWRTQGLSEYERLERYALDNGSVTLLDLQEPDQLDIEAYNAHLLKDLKATESLPLEWTMPEFAPEE